jgi:hypothetical protein
MTADELEHRRGGPDIALDVWVAEQQEALTIRAAI